MGENKLKDAKRASSTTLTTKIKEQKEPPAGSKIIEETVRIETEEIENGWLISKHFEGRFIPKGSDSDYGSWYNYTKRWYSKTDPLTVKVNDKELADEFDMDDM